MSNTATFQKRWCLKFNFPSNCHPSDVKNWARQICLREQSFDAVVSKLSDPQYSKQYKGVVIGVEELLPDGKRRQWAAASGTQVWT